MTIEGEAAGDVFTGAIIAHTVDKPGGAADTSGESHGHCRNCGAALSGAYCSQCGQATHIHRSLSSLGHDILHGVFHFEGRIWHTIPELYFHPGRLTRRYIDGERAKFVSPMALYLFTVFLMFAVFGLTGGAFTHTNSVVATKDGDVKLGMAAATDEMDAEIAHIREQLKASGLSAQRRETLEGDLADAESAREGMTALAEGNFGKLSSIGRKNRERERNAGQLGFSTGWPAFDHKLSEGLKDVEDNPRLLLYKLKVSGYKYSWALIPLSLPFMWLLFFWRRDINMYDHAIFVTYSITFIMQLLIVMSVLAALHVSSAIWGLGVLLLPVHMYAQLRGAYSLSRFGSWMRLWFLMIFASLVLTIFTVLLILLDVLG